jgi:hypothetical protein
MNPNFYRKFLIAAIDLIAIIWLVHETLYSGPEDLFGFVMPFDIVVLVIYNIYAILLDKYLFRKASISPYIQGLYSLLVILPIIVIWYLIR